MVFQEIITVYSEQHMKHINTLSGQNGVFNVNACGTIQTTVLDRVKQKETIYPYPTTHTETTACHSGCTMA
jgi:hypothetical protein